MVSAEPNGVAPATVWVSEGTGSYEGWTWVETHQPTGDMVYAGTAMLYPGAPPSGHRSRRTSRPGSSLGSAGPSRDGRASSRVGG